MIEIIAVVLLCVRNAREARESGHSSAGYVFLTIGLWFGMELAGVFIGVACGLGVRTQQILLAYVFGLLFAAIGGFISYKIAANLKIIDYNAKVPLVGPSQITVVRRESSALNVFAKWDIYLNGINIGSIENNKPITTQSCKRMNVLMAKGPNGTESPPYQFSIESGFNWQVWFNGGRFGNAHRIDA